MGGSNERKGWGDLRRGRVMRGCRDAVEEGRGGWERERERERKMTNSRGESLLFTQVSVSPACIVLSARPSSLIECPRSRDRNTHTHTQTCIYKRTRTLSKTVIHAPRTREVKNKSFPQSCSYLYQNSPVCGAP